MKQANETRGQFITEPKSNVGEESGKGRQRGKQRQQTRDRQQGSKKKKNNNKEKDTGRLRAKILTGRMTQQTAMKRESFAPTRGGEVRKNGSTRAVGKRFQVIS